MPGTEVIVVTGHEDMNTAVAAMEEITQKNATLADQTNASAQAMAQQADDLSSLILFFKAG